MSSQDDVALIVTYSLPFMAECRCALCERTMKSSSYSLPLSVFAVLNDNYYLYSRLSEASFFSVSYNEIC